MRCEDTYEDDAPRDTVTWLVLVLPPLGGNHLSDGVTDQPEAVQGKFLGVARGGGGDPGQGEDDSGTVTEHCLQNRISVSVGTFNCFDRIVL